MADDFAARKTRAAEITQQIADLLNELGPNPIGGVIVAQVETIGGRIVTTSNGFEFRPKR